jgi:hypothetical protein
VNNNFYFIQRSQINFTRWKHATKSHTSSQDSSKKIKMTVLAKMSEQGQKNWNTNCVSRDTIRNKRNIVA